MYTARVATCDEEEENDKIQEENGKKTKKFEHKTFFLSLELPLNK